MKQVKITAPKKSAPASRPTSASSSASDIKAKLLQIQGAVTTALKASSRAATSRDQLPRSCFLQLFAEFEGKK
jgi:hypothetical protein